MQPLPESPGQLEELLMDDVQRDEIFATADGAREFARSYARASLGEGGIVREISDQMTSTLKGLFAENAIAAPPSTVRELVRRPAMFDASAGSVVRPSRAAGAFADGQFGSFAEFLTMVDHRAINRAVEASPVLKALVEGNLGDGGSLVPEEFRAELLRMTLETSVVRPRATVIPIARESVVFPAIHDTTHASNVFGGVAARWAAEAGDLSGTEDQPEFAQVRLTARKLYSWAIASNELLADSAISMEALIMSIFPPAIAYFEDDAFMSGTGAGQPLGIINADALVTQAKETGQAATTIVWENIVKMYSRMYPASLGRAVWVAHNDTFPQLATMSLAVGTGGSAIWLNNGTAGPPMTILGRPVIFTEKAQTLGTAGDLYFADFSYYLIGDRQTMTVASSAHRYFETDRTAWRFTQRVDGRPWVTSALTPRQGSSTVSPFVNLATRS